MLMDGWVKFFSPQITAGVLQEKGVAIMSQTTELNGDQFSNVKKYLVTCQAVLKNVTDVMFLALLFTETCSFKEGSHSLKLAHLKLEFSFLVELFP